jgi:16S rRNA (guanine1207-N2)-methyltransferase
MSRWADDPERAADALMARCLDDIGLAGRILLVNQGDLPALIDARGLRCTVWNRRLTTGLPAAPWPPAGPFDVALVRLPKARDDQEMTAHAALSVLARSGRIVLYGGNDEGIRTAAGMLEDLSGAVETIAARGHGRVLSAERPKHAQRFKRTLADWRIVSTIEIGGRSRSWVSYPGVFAAGRIDEGTALLLGAIPHLQAGARVLDYGCGSGVIGATVLAQEPGIALDMLDSDAMALEAARENVPGARAVLGTRVGDAGPQSYDAILSNPPLHQGFAQDPRLLEQLVVDAPSHLAPGGVLQIVVQRRIAMERQLVKSFGRADITAENAHYRVWQARKA